MPSGNRCDVTIFWDCAKAVCEQVRQSPCTMCILCALALRACTVAEHCRLSDLQRHSRLLTPVPHIWQFWEKWARLGDGSIDEQQGLFQHLVESFVGSGVAYLFHMCCLWFAVPVTCMGMSKGLTARLIDAPCNIKLGTDLKHVVEHSDQ